RTWPGPGCGSGRSTISRTSGPPNWLKRTAFIIRSDLDLEFVLAARASLPALRSAGPARRAGYGGHCERPRPGAEVFRSLAASAGRFGRAVLLELIEPLPEGDAMTTAVIGATGRVGSEVVRGVLARGDAVTALVRDPGKARRAFGEPGGLHIRATRLDDPRDLTGALDGIRTVFIAMGSTGIEGVLQRIAINTPAGLGSTGQVTPRPMLRTSADSLLRQ